MMAVKKAQDEQDICDIAADDITKHQVGLPVNTGLDTDGKFRRTGTESNHSEADNQS